MNENRGQSTVFYNIRKFCALTPIYDAASALAMNKIIDDISEDFGFELENKNINVDDEEGKREMLKMVDSKINFLKI